MRRERESEYEVMVRRSKISELILNTPMTKMEIAEHTGIPYYIVGDDLSNLAHKYGIAFVDAKKYVTTDNGRRTVPIWKCSSVLEVTLPADRKVTRVKPGALPDLPHYLLLMMGYTNHIPEGGRIINNEDFHQPTQLSKVKVNIGNHWGIMMEASL